MSGFTQRAVLEQVDAAFVAANKEQELAPEKALELYTKAVDSLAVYANDDIEIVNFLSPRPTKKSYNFPVSKARGCNLAGTLADRVRFIPFRQESSTDIDVNKRDLLFKKVVRHVIFKVIPKYAAMFVESLVEGCALDGHQDRIDWSRRLLTEGKGRPGYNFSEEHLASFFSTLL